MFHHPLPIIHGYMANCVGGGGGGGIDTKWRKVSLKVSLVDIPNGI